MSTMKVDHAGQEITWQKHYIRDWMKMVKEGVKMNERGSPISLFFFSKAKSRVLCVIELELHPEGFLLFFFLLPSFLSVEHVLSSSTRNYLITNLKFSFFIQILITIISFPWIHSYLKLNIQYFCSLQSIYNFLCRP